MKILHITTSVGSQSASYRIHKALQKQGVESYIYVKGDSLKEKSVIEDEKKSSDKINAIFCNKKNSLLFKLCTSNVHTPISNGFFSTINKATITNINPDIINLHWICGNFVSIEDIKFLSSYKLVWTLHDSWPFTGGCHIPYDCRQYESKCNSCPQMGGVKFFNISKRVFAQKEKFYKSTDFVVVTPSRWMADCAKKSALFADKRIEIIGNTIDFNVFKPICPKTARSILNLPVDSKIVLFGAVNSTSDSNKGFEYLQKAVKILYEKYQNNDIIRTVVFGSEEPINTPDFGFKTIYMGHLYDKYTLALLYSAADVMVVPSKSESFSLTTLESLACGTPVVSFKIGGIPDMVEHLVNGYMAKPYDSNDLANGIDYVLNTKNGERILTDIRSKVYELFNEKIIAQKYIGVYKDMLGENEI